MTGSFTGDLPTLQRSMSGVVGAGTYQISVLATNPCGAGPATAAQPVTVP